MPISDSQFITILTTIILGVISIIAAAFVFSFRVGQKAGEIKQQIITLTEKVNEDRERITHIERIFMNNAPMFAGDILKRFSLVPTKGEKQE